jgi:Predicted ATPase
MKKSSKSSRVKKNIKVGDIEIKDITQRTVALIGMKGSGKTTALRILMREIEKSGLPAVAIDPTGSLRNKDFYNISITVPYDTALLEQVIRAAWREKAPLVLDISDMKNEQAVRFSEDLFEILFTLKDGIVVIDEIPDLTPQRGNRSEGLIRFNRKCRNKNIGFIFTTQRPASVDKNVLALADIMFVMRVAWPTDVEVYEEHLKHMGLTKEERARILTEIAHFGPGEVYVLDFRTQG